MYADIPDIARVSTQVLLDSAMQVKVADFGMARKLKKREGKKVSDDDEEGDYYRTQKGVFAVRWTAPEAMLISKFTTQSDIWCVSLPPFPLTIKLH